MRGSPSQTGVLTALLLGVFVLSLLPMRVAMAALPPALARAAKAERIPASDVALVVVRLGDQRTLVSHNAQRPMNPASLMKLVTTYAALDLLGPTYTFPTLAWVAAPPVDGRLAGNLYLQGSGDPKFTQEQLWLLLRKLRALGVRDIAGDLVLDRRAFQLPPHDPAAFDGQALRPYNAGADALLVNFSAVRLQLSPDPAGQHLRVWQETPDDRVTIDNRIALVAGECGDWREAINVSVSGYHIALTGRFAASCGDKPLNLALASGNDHVDGIFRSLWRELGGTLAGRVVEGSVPPDVVRLAEHQSPPLAELVRDTNKFSNNVMARQLFLALAPERPATGELAAARVAGWLKSKDIDPDTVNVGNGSGLSREGRIPADALRRLMLDAWNSPVMPEYVASLAILGRDGTLRRRLTDSPLAGRAHLKTGSLADVKATAGYLLSAKRQRYLLIAITNHPRASALQPCVDSLIAELLASDRLPRRCP